VEVLFDKDRARLLEAVRHEKARRLKRIAELRQQIEDERYEVARLNGVEYTLVPSDGIRITLDLV
jgi:hypothetical protein